MASIDDSDKRYIIPKENHNAGPVSEVLLEQALCQVVEVFPPREHYGPGVRGCFSGPTSLAYLFLQVSVKHPALLIQSRPANHWVEAYLAGERRTLTFEPEKRCGISCEALAYPALRAIVRKDLSLVKEVEKKISEILSTTTEPEWLYGRAGTLYIARMVSFWFPESADILAGAIAGLRQSLVADGPMWKFDGVRFYGAAHGDIGNLTQIALSSPLPHERETLQTWLLDLIQRQKSDGNWPYNETMDREHVQFCHGAPGFVQCLLSIRHLFPEIDGEIEKSIAKANALIQRYGILKKEPNLCHGLFGNGLRAFLAHGLPDVVSDARARDPKLFEKANYGLESLMAAYWPGAAWTWLVADDPDARVISFNDL